MVVKIHPNLKDWFGSSWRAL